jgi:hypothetical protein
MQIQNRLRWLIRYLWIAPVGCIVPLLALTIFIAAPQMPDMLVGLAQGDAFADQVWAGFKVGLAALFLGFSGWYWTRAVLSVETATDTFAARAVLPPAQRWAINTAPRIPFIISAVMLLVPELQQLAPPGVSDCPADASNCPTGSSHWWLALPWVWHHFLQHLPRIVAVVVAAASGIFFAWSRGWISGLLHLPIWLAPSWKPPPSPDWHRPLASLSYVPRWFLALLAAGPFGLWASLGFLVLFVPAIWITPQLLTGLSAPIAGVTALALMIPPMSLTLALFGRLPIPGRRAVALATLAVLLFGRPFDGSEYDVRTVRSSSIDPGGRPDLRRALEQWAAACFGTQARIPVVIVAAEGGASRSALWTLSAMRYLDHNTDRQLSRYLFAISGVSGGSLAAATYVRMLHAHGWNCTRSDADPWSGGPAGDIVAELGQSDFLAPSISAYFLSDVVRRLLPFGFLWHNVDTRAVALENAFDRLWQRAAPGPKDAGFLAFRAGDPKLPQLLLNGTDASLGRRVITASFRFDPTDDLFGNADDFLAITCHDIPLATAVTNSARFPFISPAGTFYDYPTCQPANDGKAPETRQILDGGYFENYGAVTALELAGAVTSARIPGRTFIPIVVVISNDAELPESQLASMVVHCATPNDLRLLSKDVILSLRSQERSSVIQALAPLLGLYATRTAHNQQALIALRHGLCLPPDDNHDGRSRLVHIPLRRPKRDDEAAPLNWVLNASAVRLITDPDRALAVGFIAAQTNMLRLALAAALSGQTAHANR